MCDIFNANTNNYGILSKKKATWDTLICVIFYRSIIKSVIFYQQFTHRCDIKTGMKPFSDKCDT